MKSIKNIEKDRVAYHKAPNRFSVHRSSLLAPQLDGLETTISFLNHFLLKRNNKSVSIKLSAYMGGDLVDSYYEEIKETKVYVYRLSQIFNLNNNIETYQIEFYSSKNLFIPFPAVIVEHTSKGCNNMVHSYNRILNDINEDKKINSTRVYESSFEVIKHKDVCSGFIFQTGQYPVCDKIKVILVNKGIKKNYTISVNLKAFSKTFISLKKYLSKFNQYSICYIQQPKQHMFFGRLLVGQFANNCETLTANHSFYNSSYVKEYFNNDNSFRQYPYFENMRNTLHFYPINGHSNVRISILVCGISYDCGNIKSPDKSFLKVDINKLYVENNLKSQTYQVIAKSRNRIATRINHQLVIGRIDNKCPASINVSLYNTEIYQPKNKKGFIWGSVLFNLNYISCLKIVGASKSVNNKAKLKIYGEDGMVMQKLIKITPDTVETISEADFKKNKIRKQGMYWYTVESQTSELQGFSINTNKKTGITSGEHNF